MGLGHYLVSGAEILTRGVEASREESLIPLLKAIQARASFNDARKTNVRRGTEPGSPWNYRDQRAVVTRDRQATLFERLLLTSKAQEQTAYNRACLKLQTEPRLESGESKCPT